MRPQHAPRATLNPPPWPPDDTEESVVGSEYHQHVIDAARDGLRMAARSKLGVSFEFDGLYLRVRDAAGRLKPLPDEAAALLEERQAQLSAQEALLGHQEAQLARIRALARAGDWVALQALLDAESGDADPNL